MDIDRQGLVVFRASRLEALCCNRSNTCCAPLPPDEVLDAAQRDRRAPRHAPVADAGASADAPDRVASSPISTSCCPAPGSIAWRSRCWAKPRWRWAPYRREGAAFGACLALLEHSGDARVQRYLDGSDGARRRFQLADRIAGLFTALPRLPQRLARGWAAGRDALRRKHCWPRCGGMYAHRSVRRIAANASTRWLVQLRRMPAAARCRPHAACVRLEPFGAAGTGRAARRGTHTAVVLYLPDPCR
jgi:exodeoxyribonuclease V gamma subunit